MSNHMRKKIHFRFLSKWMVSLLILFCVIVWIPMPYMMFTPGSAEDIKPLITVQSSSKMEQGVFMLTTVRATYANIACLLWGVFSPHAIFQKKADSLRGKTEEEYVTEQLFKMSDSQIHAILAAYHHLHIPYQLKVKGIYVIRAYSQFTKNEFLVNDQILEIDGQSITDLNHLQQKIQAHTVGDIVPVKVERKQKNKLIYAKVVNLKADKGAARIGLGLHCGQRQVALPYDKYKTVTFKQSEIAGPSAGLMFTLELINQLTPQDLTRGYRIAGTGTIDAQGNVGEIGGAQLKVVAAEHEQADLFLVPVKNYAEAQKKLNTISSKMKLVAVRTVEHALQVIEAFVPEQRLYKQL